MSNTVVDVQQIGENRYAVLVSGIVRYVGSLEECRRRALIFTPEDSEGRRGTMRCAAPSNSHSKSPARASGAGAIGGLVSG